MKKQIQMLGSMALGATFFITNAQTGKVVKLPKEIQENIQAYLEETGISDQIPEGFELRVKKDKEKGNGEDGTLSYQPCQWCNF